MSALTSWKMPPPPGILILSWWGSTKLAVPRKTSTPARLSASRIRECSREVTRPRRPMSSGTVTVRETRTSMPCASRLRACWMARAVSRSAFDGIVPVFADAPPG